MSQQTNNNNNATASQIGMGIGGILSGIGNNLWAAKERRRSQEWQNQMLNKTTAFSREDAYTAYQRDLDYSARMDAMRKAGINPFMVAGQSYSSPVARGGGASAGPMAPGNFDFIGEIPQAILQAKLINAQIQNVQADTANKTINAELQAKYGGKIQEATIVNMAQTNRNLEVTEGLIEQQKLGAKAQNTITWIRSKYEAALRSAELAQTEEQTKKISSEILQLKEATELIKVQIQNGNLTSNEIEARIQSILANTGLTREQIETEKSSRPTKSSPSSFWGTVNKFSNDIDTMVERSRIIKRDR